MWCTAGDEAAAQQQREKQLAGTRAVAAAGREAAAAVAVVVVAQARERARREELAYWPGLDWHKAVVCLWRGGLGRRTKGSPGFSLSASLGTGFDRKGAEPDQPVGQQQQRTGCVVAVLGVGG